MRFGPLDGARGIAVFFVVLSHTSGRGLYLSESLQFQGIGKIGVYLFFCLSAYLLTENALKRGWKLSWVKKFFIKRALRIWPLYTVVLLGTFIVQIITGNIFKHYLHINQGRLGFLQHFLIYRGDGIFWSLVIEEQFYLLFPAFLFYMIKRPQWAKFIFSFVIITNFILFLLKHFSLPPNSTLLGRLTPNTVGEGNYFDIFLTTMLITFYKKQILSVCNRKFYFITINMLFFTTLALSLCLVSEQFLIFNRPAYGFRYLTLLFAIVFSFFIISLRQGNPIGTVLNRYLIKTTGLYGFSIYLLHFPIIQLINLLDILPWFKFIISLPTIYFVGFAGYHFIEEPFIKWSQRLTRTTVPVRS